MSPKLSFLDLPSEIRHAIYLHYVAVENGYMFNFETGKLAAVGCDGNMEPIDHALKFTCKTVAQEMMGLDFQVNPIKFSTGYSDQWRINAARFHNMQAYFNYIAVSMLQGPGPEDHDADSNADQGDARESQEENRDSDEGGERDAGISLNTNLNENMDGETINDHVQDQDHNHNHFHHQDQEQGEDDDQDGNEDQDEDEDEEENTNEQILLPPCCTDAIVEEVAQRYPSFKPILEMIMLGTDITTKGHHYGLVPTFKRQAVLYTLELALQHGSIPEDWYEQIFHRPRHLIALRERYPPWLCCLSAFEFLDVKRQSVTTSFTKRQEVDYWKRPHLSGLGRRQYTQGKYRFSAAALAIRFLSRLPVSLRMHLRKIQLQEDRVSVAYPETHAQGLIKFCLENPRLHIERRLDLWRNVFQSLPYTDELQAFTFTLEDNWVTDTAESDGDAGLSSVTLTDKVALWIMEALALPSLGMPRESFTLVLDGGEAPQICSEIFQQVVQRDAAWQAAWEIVTANEFAEESFSDKRIHNCYRIDGFPEAMRDMENNLRGFIQCTFDLRPSIWDVEKEAEKFRHLTLEQSHALPVDNQVVFHPPEPLPSWQDLLAENILPEFFGEQEIVEGKINYERYLDDTDDEETEDDESVPDLSDENFARVRNLKHDMLMERLDQGFMFFNLADPSSDSGSDDD